MAGSIENSLIERLRSIRSPGPRMDGRKMMGRTRLAGRLKGLEVQVYSFKGTLIGREGCVRAIEPRLLHVEERLGIEG